MGRFIELLAHERDGKSIPSGHFRRMSLDMIPKARMRAFDNL